VQQSADRPRHPASQRISYKTLPELQRSTLVSAASPPASAGGGLFITCDQPVVSDGKRLFGKPCEHRLALRLLYDSGNEETHGRLGEQHQGPSPPGPLLAWSERPRSWWQLANPVGRLPSVLSPHFPLTRPQSPSSRPAAPRCLGNPPPPGGLPAFFSLQIQHLLRTAPLKRFLLFLAAKWVEVGFAGRPYHTWKDRSCLTRLHTHGITHKPLARKRLYKLPVPCLMGP